MRRRLGGGSLTLSDLGEKSFQADNRLIIGHGSLAFVPDPFLCTCNGKEPIDGDVGAPRADSLLNGVPYSLLIQRK